MVANCWQSAVDSARFQKYYSATDLVSVFCPPPSLLPPHSTLPANSLHHVSRDVQRGQQVLPLPSLSSHLGLSATTLPGAVRANTFTAALLTGLGPPSLPHSLPSPGQLQTPTCSVQPVLVN